MPTRSSHASAPTGATVDPAPNAQQLVHSCQGMVRSLAWKIKQKLPPQVDLDDLIGYGQLGLVQAAGDFEPDRGGLFSTYAYYRIRGAILDGLSQMAWFSRADFHRARYERMAGELLEAESSSQGSPAPEGDRPLAAEAGWFADLAAKLSMVYLASGAESGNGATLVDGGIAPPAQVIASEMREKLMEMIAALPPAAQALIRGTYFEGVTLQEAGKRMGISKAWASRLHARALAQLSRSMSRATHAENC
ncbi:MAG TPA: sigma-70 family RNA polymerase sigma factor [Tepidisphaeraceae bacterium]